jgi:hypothetical protein
MVTLRSNDGDESSRVNSCHVINLPLFQIGVILNNTERIHPQEPALLEYQPRA